jgi:hypothetical protein
MTRRREDAAEGARGVFRLQSGLARIRDQRVGLEEAKRAVANTARTRSRLSQTGAPEVGQRSVEPVASAFQPQSSR